MSSKKNNLDSVVCYLTVKLSYLKIFRRLNELSFRPTKDALTVFSCSLTLNSNTGRFLVEFPLSTRGFLLHSS